MRPIPDGSNYVLSDQDGFILRGPLAAVALVIVAIGFLCALGNGNGRDAAGLGTILAVSIVLTAIGFFIKAAREPRGIPYSPPAPTDSPHHQAVPTSPWSLSVSTTAVPSTLRPGWKRYILAPFELIHFLKNEQLTQATVAALELREPDWRSANPDPAAWNHFERDYFAGLAAALVASSAGNAAWTGGSFVSWINGAQDYVNALARAVSTNPAAWPMGGRFFCAGITRMQTERRAWMDAAVEATELLKFSPAQKAETIRALAANG